MKKSLLLVMCLMSLITLKAQTFTWARGMGGPSLDNGLSVAVDGAGNVYTTGYFQGTGDFDPGTGVVNLTSAGGTDIFISKLNSAGNLVWVKRIGGVGSDVARAIKVDAAGNVYTIGYFGSSTDFDPGVGSYNLTNLGSNDVFISKLDASGNFVWAKQFGSTGNDMGYGMAIDAGGNVYTTGAFENTVDFDPGTNVFNMSSSGNQDIFVSKLDANGAFVWAKSMGSSLGDFGLCITLDGSGNVYTSGNFQGTGEFDPGAATYTLSAVNGRDIFVSKLSGTGNFIYAKQIGGGGDQTVNSIVVDPYSNLYMTGSFQSLTDFDPGAGTYTLSSNGGTADDAFVSKLNSNGNFLWARQIGGSGFDYGRGITVDVSSVYIIGEFNGTVDFDPNAGTSNITALSSSYDMFITRLDVSGNLIWAHNIGSSTGNSSGNSVALDASGNLYTTGLYSGATDFDVSSGVFTITPPGSQADVFVLKMNPQSTGVDELYYSLKAVVYPNPASSMLNIKTDAFIESVSVYNTLGVLLQQETSGSFSVEQLPDGIYTIQVKTANATGSIRFVKE